MSLLTPFAFGADILSNRDILYLIKLRSISFALRAYVPGLISIPQLSAVFYTTPSTGYLLWQG